MNCSELPPRIYESLKMLCCLAVAKRPLLANEIAIATEIPAAQAPKVLQQLRWAGFVGSRRGPTGGFWLVRPPQRIRVIDVYSFFAPQNRKQKPDPILQSLGRVTAPCEQEVARITVADLARHSSCKALPKQHPGAQLKSKAPRMPRHPRKAMAEGTDYVI
jgi:Rrf2 family protein